MSILDAKPASIIWSENPSTVVPEGVVRKWRLTGAELSLQVYRGAADKDTPRKQEVVACSGTYCGGAPIVLYVGTCAHNTIMNMLAFYMQRHTQI